MDASEGHDSLTVFCPQEMEELFAATSMKSSENMFCCLFVKFNWQ